MVDDSPTARALRCLELLQEAPGLSASQLGERLGVSPRAARRYVAILRTAQIPVESTRGPYGGYRLGRGVRLPPLTFSVAEAVALVMAALDGAHPAGDPQHPVGSALRKLLRSLPQGVAASADTIRRTASAAPDSAAARPDPLITQLLAQACVDRRLVRLYYRSEAATTTRLVEVDPWAVVVRHGRWYLLGDCHTSQARRAYRIDRVRRADVLDQPGSDLPDDLDPVRTLEDHLASGWDHEVEILIDAPVAAVSWLSRSLGRLDAVDPITTRLTGSTSNPYWYAEQLALLPVPFHVVRDAQLRHTVTVLGQRLLAAGVQQPETPVAAGDSPPSP